MIWDIAALDALLAELENRVRDGCAEKDEESVHVAEVLGFWLMRLRDCKKLVTGTEKT